MERACGHACAALDRLGGSGRAMLLLIGLGSGWLLACQLLRHYAFETPAYDLRLHEELVANTLRGRFLYSDLLGGSFLSHHVSLIFVLAAPLYALWPDPAWLLILQGALLGGAAWLLWRLAALHGLRPALAAAVVAAFLLFKGVHAGYFRGFQPEILGMCFLLGFFWAVRAKRWAAAAALGALAVSCREDFSLFLLAAGLGLLFHRDTRAFGLATLVFCAAWIGLCYGVLIPRAAGAGQMSGMDRWSQYGSRPLEIAAFWATHPLTVLKAVFNHDAAGHLRRLLFLPLLDPLTLLVIGAPWLIYTTSSFDQQSGLSGAYAAMFVAPLFVGLVRVLGRGRARAWAADSRAALLAVLLLAGLNARLAPLPKSWQGLPAAHAALSRINRDVAGSRVLAQGCIIPHLGWPRVCDMVGSPRALPPAHYDLVILHPGKDPWPLKKQALLDLAASLESSGDWRREDAGGLLVFYLEKEQQPGTPDAGSGLAAQSRRPASSGSRWSK